MKKIYLYCIVIFLIAILFGCSNKRDGLIGKWKVLTMDDGKNTYYSGEVMKFFSMPPFRNIDMLEGAITIRNDNSFEANLDLEKFEGTWSLNGNSLTLTKDNTGKGESFEILDSGDEEKKYYSDSHYHMLILEENLNGEKFRIELRKIDENTNTK